jgi:hypothetical protein
MCYSKEVSLVAGTAITAFSYRYYVQFYLQKKTQTFSQRMQDIFHTLRQDTRGQNVRNFSLWFILGFAAIGGHQFGEFASIATGSEFIYKLGLVSSILCTYFILVAFEQLAGKRLGSKIIAVVIFLVTIDIFRTEMKFENTHFWVRGLNHKYWAMFWLANWVYLCSAIILLGYKAKSQLNKRIYWLYGLGGINISFIISWLYAILAHRYGNICTISNCSYHFLQDFIYKYDFPSLWCTFTVIQAPFIYMTLRKIKTSYAGESFHNWQPTLVTKLSLIGITIIVMALWYTITPMVLGVSWKVMTK